MREQPGSRYEVVVEQGAPRGGLYELEQTTFYRIVDKDSNEVIMTFESLMEASLSTDTGMWNDYRYTGVSEVTISPDGQSVIVTYHGGEEEMAPLPG